MNYKSTSVCDRNNFPILMQTVHAKPLVYLDSAASSQMPNCVIDAISTYHKTSHANIHRGVHALSERATDLYEQARTTIQKFIHAKSSNEIIFTSGTTAAINLVARSYGQDNFTQNDEILITEMEHHSNIVPWQSIAKQTGAIIKVIPVTESGELDLEAARKLITKKTKMLALTHVSNVLGTINPVKQLIKMAHDFAVPVLLDGAQAVAHLAVDVVDLDCDFYVFSAHKIYGPTGLGVLYAKRELLEKMTPTATGGGMIRTVGLYESTFADIPAKFEAGTPAIAQAIGLGAAIDYVSNIGFTEICNHENLLLNKTVKLFDGMLSVKRLGNPQNKTAVVSFVIDNAHAHDAATILDNNGVAVRAGHHCAMPLMQKFKVAACLRVSFGVYNTLDDIDTLESGLLQVTRIFNDE